MTNTPIAAKLATALRAISQCATYDEPHSSGRWMRQKARAALAEFDTAKVAEPPSPAWQPISTAPKDDKTYVLGWAESRYRDGYQQVIMRWFNDAGDPLHGFWVCNAIQYYPTHWMPLPQPPSAAPEEKEG